MPRRLPQMPPVAGVDLDFRPASYHADVTPVDAIVQNIAGTSRRQLVHAAAAGEATVSLGELDHRLLADSLPHAMRRELAGVHPRLMGGEYLPQAARGEVEIARVELASVTGDVLRVTARRRGDRWRYRMVDEYDTTFRLIPTTSRQPLTLGQLVYLLETADGDLLDDYGLGVVRCWVHQQLDYGDDADSAMAFVSVSSVVYPQLADYYAGYVAEWVAARLADDEEDDVEPREDDERDASAAGDAA